MRHASKINGVTLAAFVLLAFPTHVYPRSREVPTVVSVRLPGGGTVDIGIDDFENPLKSAGNKTLLAVHGLAHTGKTFEPLANELFKAAGRNKIGRVLAINFPFRNGSGLPSKPQFGDLTVEDYTAILLGVLDQLPRQLISKLWLGIVWVGSSCKPPKTVSGPRVLRSKKLTESKMYFSSRRRFPDRCHGCLPNPARAQLLLRPWKTRIQVWASICEYYRAIRLSASDG
jgi:hypothetical protein